MHKKILFSITLLSVTASDIYLKSGQESNTPCRETIKAIQSMAKQKQHLLQKIKKLPGAKYLVVGILTSSVALVASKLYSLRNNIKSDAMQCELTHSSTQTESATPSRHAEVVAKTSRRRKLTAYKQTKGSNSMLNLRALSLQKMAQAQQAFQQLEQQIADLDKQNLDLQAQVAQNFTALNASEQEVNELQAGLGSHLEQQHLLHQVKQQLLALTQEKICVEAQLSEMAASVVNYEAESGQLAETLFTKSFEYENFKKQQHLLLEEAQAQLCLHQEEHAAWLELQQQSLKDIVKKKDEQIGNLAQAHLQFDVLQTERQHKQQSSLRQKINHKQSRSSDILLGVQRNLDFLAKIAQQPDSPVQTTQTTFTTNTMAIQTDCDSTIEELKNELAGLQAEQDLQFEQRVQQGVRQTLAQLNQKLFELQSKTEELNRLQERQTAKTTTSSTQTTRRRLQPIIQALNTSLSDDLEKKLEDNDSSPTTSTTAHHTTATQTDTDSTTPRLREQLDEALADKEKLEIQVANLQAIVAQHINTPPNKATKPKPLAPSNKDNVSKQLFTSKA